MDTIIKINATWKIGEQTDSWEATAIVNEDGWFEGIAFDTGSLIYTGERFIFGAYSLEKAISFLKITPHQISAPLIFTANKKDDEYIGEISKLILHGQEKIGTTVIAAEEVQENPEEVDQMIKNYKSHMFDEYSRMIYEISMESKNQMIELVNKK